MYDNKTTVGKKREREKEINVEQHRAQEEQKNEKERKKAHTLQTKNNPRCEI